MPPTHLLVSAPGLRVSRPRVERAEARAGGHRWIIVATLLLAVAATLGYLKTWPPLATVMSASMAPTINTGDIVVLKRLDAPAAINQVVMVRVPDDARARFGYPPVVIHRVVAIAPDGTVTTKGDAKEEIDPFTVPRTAIDTRVLTHIPAAGQAFGFLSSTLGLLWLAGGAALFFGLPLLERYRESQRRVVGEREERELVLETLRAQVELLPGQIERAVATAVAAVEPPAPRSTARLVASSSVATPAPARHRTASRRRTRTRRRTGPRRARRRWTAPRRGPRAGARRPRRAGPHRARARRPRRAGPGRARLRHAGPRRARARRGRGRHPGGRGARAGRVGHPVRGPGAAHDGARRAAHAPGAARALPRRSPRACRRTGLGRSARRAGGSGPRRAVRRRRPLTRAHRLGNVPGDAPHADRREPHSLDARAAAGGGPAG